MSNNMFTHEPVMLAEILDVFSGLSGGVFLDATLGGAGHAQAVLEA
ncbi:MAG: 16S rRNA (cytosine(1402)-N(4))-methyltransferase, partial [Ilumatobacteraceae bacterium]|nr:16S rRNA (cytosine(1402)-N(4))-methyltransferase [Ilumatobacteraceae bacterium]